MTSEVNFTGEFFVPGMTDERIHLDHLERYKFATGFVQGKAVLDLACGFGYAGPIMLSSGAKSYEGVDINEGLVANASKTFVNDNIRYFHGDICTYKPETSFDIITCFETIEHVPDFRNALLNLHRLLKDDGRLLISSPNRIITSPDSPLLSDKPTNPYHCQEFTIAELKDELACAGFAVADDCVFGQRAQLNITNKLLCRIRDRLFGDPCATSSPKVTRLGYKRPRYFILVATKR